MKPNTVTRYAVTHDTVCKWMLHSKPHWYINEGLHSSNPRNVWTDSENSVVLTLCRLNTVLLSNSLNSAKKWSQNVGCTLYAVHDTVECTAVDTRHCELWHCNTRHSVSTVSHTTRHDTTRHDHINKLKYKYKVNTDIVKDIFLLHLNTITKAAKRPRTVRVPRGTTFTVISCDTRAEWHCLCVCATSESFKIYIQS